MNTESSSSRLEGVLAENARSRGRAISLRQRARCAIDRTRAVAQAFGVATLGPPAGAQSGRRWTRLAGVAAGGSDGMPKPGEVMLRELARAAIRAGTLPTRAGDGTRGGRGTGRGCALCHELISREQTDVEIEIGHDGSFPHVEVLHLHVRCCAVWDSERVKVELERG